MTFKKFLIIPLLAVFPAIVGCGNDCKSSCEDAKKCADANNKNADCDSFCDKAEDLSDKAGCSDQFDDVESCANDQKDVCDDKDTSCNAKGTAFTTCITKYCSVPANNAACTAAFAAGP